MLQFTADPSSLPITTIDFPITILESLTGTDSFSSKNDVTFSVSTPRNCKNNIGWCDALY